MPPKAAAPAPPQPEAVHLLLHRKLPVRPGEAEEERHRRQVARGPIPGAGDPLQDLVCPHLVKLKCRQPHFRPKTGDHDHDEEQNGEIVDRGGARHARLDREQQQPRAAQRHLRVAAQWVRLARRDGKPAYLRHGPRTWRLIHWTAYASWPLAVVHGLGTGSDTPVRWVLGLTVACVALIAALTAWRLGYGWPSHAAARLLGALALLLTLIAGGACLTAGPLQPGWARRAGTPSQLINGGVPANSRPAGGPR